MVSLTPYYSLKLTADIHRIPVGMLADTANGRDMKTYVTIFNNLNSGIF
jgi:hypothetical protein